MISLKLSVCNQVCKQIELRKFLKPSCSKIFENLFHIHTLCINKRQLLKQNKMESTAKTIKSEKIQVPNCNFVSNEKFLPNHQTIDIFMNESSIKINSATKASNAIPCDRKEDWDYYSTFKAFRQVMQAQGNSIKQQMLTILKYNGIKVVNPGDNIADNLEMLTEANDQLLERISINLDEADGIKKVKRYLNH